MRPAREIMGDLAATGMTPDQIALVMELSAAVSAEARPVVDESAARRRERDKEYQAQKRNGRRQISADSDDVADEAPLSLPPNEKISNPPTHTPENITPARKGNRIKQAIPAKPDDVDEQTWADFLTHRRAKSAPVTKTVVDGIRSEAVKAGYTLNAALAETVTRGWQSFRADWARPAVPNAGAAPGSFLAHLAGQGP